MKIFAAALATLSIFFLSAGTAQAQNFFLSQEQSNQNGVLISRPTPIDERIAFILQQNDIQDLEQVATWIKGQILYRKDPGSDQWSNAEETLERRSGDCEDFAFLTEKILKILGYEPQIMAFVQDGRAHAACVVQSNGQYQWFDNGELKKTSAKDIRSFVNEVSHQYHLASVWELNPDRGSWKKIFQMS